MTLDEAKSIFNHSLTEGKDAKILALGKRYFSFDGETIVSYKTSAGEPNSNGVLLSSLSKMKKGKDRLLDKLVCDCCGEYLYKFADNTTEVEIEDDQELLSEITIDPSVILKRHTVWIGYNGSVYRTCFKKSSCIARELDKRLSVLRDISDDLTVVNFWGDDFVKIESMLNSVSSNQMLYDARFSSLNETFERYVIPFVEKWSEENISKSNVVPFFDDLVELKKHSDIYASPDIQTEFVNRALKLIGV